jgi:hypothetical protein
MSCEQRSNLTRHHITHIAPPSTLSFAPTEARILLVAILTLYLYSNRQSKPSNKEKSQHIVTTNEDKLTSTKSPD